MAGTPATELVQRAKAALQRAGVPAEQYSFVAAKRDPGSMVSVRFVSQDALEEAKQRLFCQRVPAYDTGKPVWLDFARTAEENKPVKMIHRAHEQIGVFFTNKGISKKLEKFPRDRRIKVQGHIVLSIFKGSLKWGAAAKEDLTQDEMDEIISFAES